MAAGESPKPASSAFVLSAVALAVFVGAMVWALSGPGDEAPLAPAADSQADEGAAPKAAGPSMSNGTTGSAPTKAPAAPAAPPAPEVDLFAGEMPDFMASTHARVLDKKPLGSPEQKALYDYGKANPSDARPQLLLAWDSMNRDWDGIGVRMYKIAFRADVRAKQDPSMLRDLIRVAANHDRVEYRETTALMREAFGSEAIGPIEEELERLRGGGGANTKKIERLERLHEELLKPAQ